MRIVFTGASGAGKTTVLNALIEKANSGDLAFPLPHVLYSQTQNVYNSYRIYTEEQVLSTSQYILKDVQFTLFEERVALEKEFGSFISDRSILDYYIWTLMRCSGVLTYEDVTWLKIKKLKCVRRYNLVLHFESPPFAIMPIGEDGFKLRSFCQEYIFRQLHANVLDLSIAEIKFVPWASVEKRVEQVEELITLCWKGIK